MARPLRPDTSGAWYHVINRGADRQDIFSSDADFARFEGLLGDAVGIVGVEIHAYSLMTNHFHLVVHCPEGGLSDALKTVESRYASVYNKIHERSGPLFEGRFTSLSIDTPLQRHVTGRYVHRNPLDIVPVAVLGNYRWSSFGAYVGCRRAPSWLTTTELHSQFGGDQVAYQTYVETTVDSDRQACRTRVAVADGALDELESVVSVVCGVDGHALRSPRRGVQNDPRLIVITLAVELRLASTMQIAERFCLADQASVRATARRGRVRLADDERLARLRERILSDRWTH